VIAAQRLAASLDSAQPTAIVYRTVKGWRYGLQGRASHGAGHALCSEEFHHAVDELTGSARQRLPRCEDGKRRCDPPANGRAVLEQCFWEALGVVRGALQDDRSTVDVLARRLQDARDRLDARRRGARPAGPCVERIYEAARLSVRETPAELRLAPGAHTTLRGELGRALGHLNRCSDGAVLVAAADLLASTSVNAAAAGFPPGYWNARDNPGARVISGGGICEDAIAGILSGIAGFSRHLAVGSSYGAFLAPLGHVAARLHGIGAQARSAAFGIPFGTMVLVCAHAGLKTGEDGPTHADPQALQLLQGNFPPGVAVTLTPWEPQEIWPLLCAALARRPALVAPFVTRPSETVLDRAALGLAPPQDAASGLYLLKRPEGASDLTIVLQESAVAYAFVVETLPLLEKDGLRPWVYYVASAELFDLLPAAEQRRIFPEQRAREAMGITGFTQPTMDRWILSSLGREATLHPYRDGHYLGSGQGEVVLEQAGLDGRSQYRAIRRFLDARRPAAKRGGV
jgi:transketolase